MKRIGISRRTHRFPFWSFKEGFEAGQEVPRRAYLLSCRAASLGPECFSAWISNDEEFPSNVSCSHLYTCKYPVLFGLIPAQRSGALAARLVLHTRISQQDLKLHMCLMVHLQKDIMLLLRGTRLCPFNLGRLSQTQRDYRKS